MAVTSQTKVWTYEDLFDLPDDGRRFEIIDGELYEMTGPNMAHAEAITNFILVLVPALLERAARFFTAPLDVFLAGGNPVQPDLVVLFPERMPLKSARGIEGPPNLVIEVMSPSNSARDRIVKRALYAQGGVPEYWLASPEAALIEVLTLDGNVYRTHIRAGGDEMVTSLVLPQLPFRHRRSSRSRSKVEERCRRVEAVMSLLR